MLNRLLSLAVIALLFLSCAEETSSGPTIKNSSASRSSEIICDANNEGMVVKPADSEIGRICKNGTWIAIESSSSGSFITSSDDKENMFSSSSFIASETKQSSSSNIAALSSNEEFSNSSFEQSSDSHEDIQLSSSDYAKESSSSSDETKMYLCDDGVTYVLDLANCEIESSSSETEMPESSSDAEESSSSRIESSGSISSSSIIGTSSIAVSSSSEESSSSMNSIYDAENNTLTDLRDNHVYRTVTIGTQVWMAENLNYLPEDTVGTCFAGRSVCGGGERWSLVEGDCSVYGRLYDTYIPSPYGCYLDVCPDGWSVPTPRKWSVLLKTLDSTVAGKKMKLNDEKYWANSEATNESGFSAIQTGYYSRFSGFNRWDSIPPAVFTIWVFKNYTLDGNAIRLTDFSDAAGRTEYGDNLQISVRCIKD
jgi:uncharacterized protein (TIGR02145 family)